MSHPHTHTCIHTPTHIYTLAMCVYSKSLKSIPRSTNNFFFKPACVTKHWLTPLFPKESLECHAGSTIPLTPTELHRPASLYIFLKHKLPRLSLQHSLLEENWLVRIQGRIEGTAKLQAYFLSAHWAKMTKLPFSLVLLLHEVDFPINLSLNSCRSGKCAMHFLRREILSVDK